MTNWYNLPLYYDVSFSHEMQAELVFLQQVLRLYAKQSSPRILEPACGTGRLLVPLVRAGFDCTGFDKNTAALDYLQHKLRRNSLHARLFQADMADFHVNGKFDAAFCTVDTFRHLLTEQDALKHLQLVGQALKKNAIYVLGMHLLTDREITSRVTRWTHRRGGLTVKTSMSLAGINRQKRRETLKVVLQPVTTVKQKKHTSVYDLRTYTLPQFKSLLRKTGLFRIHRAYDEYYDLNRPVELTNKSEYAVFLLQRI